MAKRERKTVLVRDQVAERIPLASFERLVRTPRHQVELRRKLREEVDKLAEGEYVRLEDYADVIEVLKCLAFFNNVDWRDVEDAIWHRMVTDGKYIDGILVTKAKLDEH